MISVVCKPYGRLPHSAQHGVDDNFRSDSLIWQEDFPLTGALKQIKIRVF